MRIVHLATSDTSGGAARAASRLHNGLTQLGVNEIMGSPYPTLGASGGRMRAGAEA